MPPANPAEKLRAAPVADLVEILLKQFKRLLADRGVDLTSVNITSIGQAAALHQTTTHIEAIIPVMDALVQESMATLQERFGLTFAEALAADMTEIGGWETTAEFIDVANHKSNAELRISAGAALLAFLGDKRHVGVLFTVITDDGGADDVDATFARRALSHVAHIAPDAEHWEATVRAAL